MILAAPPTGPVEVPAIVGRLAGDDDAVAVWQNTLGGLTFRLGSAENTRFVKWMPPGPTTLRSEAVRLSWASPYTRVPRVLDSGSDNTGSWMMTAGIPGRNAIDPRYTSNARGSIVAARAIGEGLRLLHDRLPVGACKFDWSVPERIGRSRAAGLDVPSVLEVAPPVDRLVVCHGDACAPNTLLADDDSFAGHVDLGSLGVADRWADLAVATWSLDWNFAGGTVLENELLAAYGVARDEPRIEYYRALWDAT